MKAYKASRNMSRQPQGVKGATVRRYPGISLSMDISPRKRESTSMASEYLVLTEIASNLSTYVQNRVSNQEQHTVQDNNNKGKIGLSLLQPRNNSSCKTTSLGRSQGTISDDAKLLLNFKETASRPEQHPVTSFPNTISPSFSFEARRHCDDRISDHHNHHRNLHHKNTKDGASQKEGDRNVKVKFHTPCDSERTFSLTFPSLSLSDDVMLQRQQHVPIESKPLNHSHNTPSQLFSRLIRKRSTLDVSEVAEALADNVMLSFITALEWRTKVWIGDLSRKISTSFNKEAAKITTKPHESFSDMKKKKKSSKVNGKKNIDLSTKKGSSGSRLDELKAKFKKSQEARVVKALSQTWSTVHVHDIRTTFYVLERQYDDASTSNSLEEEKKIDNESYTLPFVASEVFRPLKKCRTVTDEDCQSQAKKPNTPTKYTLSHVLNLDSRCSVSTSSEERISVSLQTPGVIHGTFVRDEDGEAFLVDVSIDLDTENLAVSMEQKSRFVVRTAAEECIISPPCVSQLRRQTSKGWSRPPLVLPSYASDYQSSNNRQQVVKTFAPESPFVTRPETVDNAALVTPNENGFISSDSEDMPPPPPRLPFDYGKSTTIFDTRSTFLNPRRVSPTSEMNSISNHSGEQLLSPTPERVTIYDVPTNQNSSPALVSPHTNVNHHMKKGKEDVIEGKGPLLPALVEVACAAHTGSLA